jgi:hypothetical protein
MRGGRASRAASGGEHGGAAQTKNDFLSTSQRGDLPMFPLWYQIRGNIVVSISACHTEDPGSIPGRGVFHAGHVACKALHAEQGNDQRRRLDIASTRPRGSPAHPPASPPIRAASGSTAKQAGGPGGRAGGRAGGSARWSPGTYGDVQAPP